jgi:hypothetical protein
MECDDMCTSESTSVRPVPRTANASYRASFARSGQSLIAFAATAIWLMGCDAVLLFPQDDVKPVAARFAADGSSCTVEVFYPTHVVGTPAALVGHYRLSDGTAPLSAAPVIDVHAISLSFADSVAIDSMLLVGDAAAEPTPLMIEASRVDATPPTLVAAGFDADADATTVVLTYSEALDPDAASDVSAYAHVATLAQPTAADVAACGREVRLTFDALPADTTLRLRGPTDLSGNAGPEAQAVKVASLVDSTPATVASIAFADSAALASVEVTFDKPVDRTSAERIANYVLQPGNLRPTSATLTEGGRVVVLTFASLDPPHTLAVSNVLDLARNPIDAPEDDEVIADRDETPPTLLSAAVVGRQTGITIRATFSEALAAASATTLTRFELSGADESSPLTASAATLQPGGAAVDLVFAYLPGAGELSVSGVADLSGNVIAAGAMVAVDDSDDLAPRVISARFVADQAVPTVDVAFDKTLDPDTAAQAALFVFSTGQAAKAAELRDDGRTVRLIAGGLDRGTKLSVSGVRDAGGNLMLPAVNNAIAAAVDTRSPQVESVAFLPDAERPTIEVVFDEAIDKKIAETLSSYASSIGSAQPVMAELLDDGRTVLLTFGPLDKSTELTIRNVVDLAGKATITATHPIDKTDTAPPAIVSAAFVANQAAPTIDVVFSEALDKALAESAGLYLAGVDHRAATTAVLQSDGRTVRLTMPPMAVEDELSVRAVADLAANVMPAGEPLTIAAAEDAAAPFLVSAAFSSNSTTPKVTIVYSEAVDRPLAETLSSYRTTPGDLAPTAAVLGTDSRTVTLTFPKLARADRLAVMNVTDFGGVVISEAGAAISPAIEQTLPTVTSATVTSFTKVSVVFSEVVDKTTAETKGNFTVSGGLRTTSAIVQTDGRTVVVTITDGTVTAGDEITIANVTDLNGNVMASVSELTLD